MDYTRYFDSGLKTFVEKLWAGGVKKASPDDSRSNDEEIKVLMIKLLESEFIEPNFFDYL